MSVTNGNASLTSGAANWTYNLGAAAAATTLTVTDASGKVVYTGAGEHHGRQQQLHLERPGQ